MKFLTELNHNVKEARFNPGENIFEENVIDDGSIYFLLKGNVKICTNSINRYHKHTKRELVVIPEGKIFGEMAFFSGNIRAVSAYSKDFVSVLFVKREDFIKTLRSFPHDYQRYCQIKDQLLLGNNFKAINLNCYACKQYDHLGSDCPLLHYNKELFLQKLLNCEGEPQYRRSLARRKHKSLNSLFNKKFLEKMAADFTEDSTESPLLRVQRIKNFYEDSEEEDKETSPKNFRSFNLRLQTPGSLEKNFQNEGKRSQINSPSVSFKRMKKSNNYVEKEENFENCFDKFCNYSFYFHFSNKKEFSNAQTKKKTEIKFQRQIQSYFLKKKTETINLNSKNFSEKNVFDFKNFFEFANIFNGDSQKKLIENKRNYLSFYDVAYEVLTNVKLRKTLANLKDRNLKVRKQKTRMTFIE